MQARILIIDRDQLVSQQLKDALQPLGYDVTLAYDGMEGLELTRRIRPDIILMDPVLPKIDGNRLCRYLREDPDFSKLPILTLSELPEDAFEEALRAGATASLKKETVPQLLPKLKRMIDQLTVTMSNPSPAPASRKDVLTELLNERERLREIIRILPEGTLEVDSNHRIIYANALACNLLGRREATIIGIHFSDLFPPESRAQLAAILNRILNRETSSVTEHIHVFDRSIRLTFLPIGGAKADSRSVIFLEDIKDDTAQIERLVEIERKKMKGMVESMVDGVLMTDENDEIVVINHAAKIILRVSRKSDTISKKYFQETLGFYPFRLTKGMVHKPGSQVTIKEQIKIFNKTLDSVVSPVFDSEGRQTGTVVVLRDISDQKQQEEKRNEFLSVISHELRTPLASIGGSLDLVLKNVVGSINEKQRRYLELARDSCQKLNVVIDDLLDLTKFEKGKMEIRMEPISLLKLVKEATDKFQASAIEKQIQLKFTKPDQEVSIYGDYNRLIQVMNNLLSNAIKFTPEGGEIEVEIFIPRVAPSHIGVSVRDTGPGIPADLIERVFDKFEQVRNSDNRKVGGTGLGLAISRSIIDAHKGKIWLESKAGHGAKFIFLLPLEKRASLAPEIYAELSKTISKEEISALVLSVDENSSYMLKGMLLERGFKVLLSDNPKEALAIVQQEHPQLIILDYDSEPSARTQMIEILAHDPETSKVPIINFYRSSENDLNLLPYAIHLQKPIDMEQLLQALSHALSRTQGTDERKKILVVDDDPNLRMICREALEYQKYRVVEAADGAQALDILKQTPLDLILLDIMLPGIDGFQIAQIIRSHISTSTIPIIFLTAKGETEDKVRALKSGGTDYLVKPFDSMELGARIETILERSEKELATSPTTRLPGTTTIEKEINRLLSRGETFALCYIDLDNLKAYNDAYGYAKADGVVKQTGDILRETVIKLGEPSDFVGHIAGDDFVLITRPERTDRLCLNIMERFDHIIPFFYKQEDRDRGYIEGPDRYGVFRQFPIMSISIACLTNESVQLTDHVQIATLAAEYKRIAKAIPGSSYIRNGQKVTTS
ncbi:MAG: hypothetical protein C5B54_10660 [Acidobacteria bacterium]|nr:MAG: hypothetical protein C5B54_10660 [Acidobacteriota bacterium]